MEALRLPSSDRFPSVSLCLSSFESGSWHAVRSISTVHQMS